jgi:hypothetical protein
MSLAGCVRLAMVAMDERAAAAPSYLPAAMMVRAHCYARPKLLRILSHLTHVRETAQSWTG